MLKLCKLHACPNGTLGLHLSRAPWDPYPWVSGIQDGSSAQRAGVLSGDTVLEMNGCDVLGQKISHIAEHIGAHWKSGASYVTVLIWRNQPDGVTSCDDDSRDGKPQSEMAGKHNLQQHQSINQQSLQKFATCLQHIAQLLECPVCLEVIRPPGWQCCNGHVLCNNCRSRSVKCPVCRVPLGPRGRCLMSDKLFTLLAESFPCNGVRHNDGNKSGSNSSPEEIKKCTQDFHNHPKSKEKNQIKSTKHVQDQVKYEETFKEQSCRSKSVVAIDAGKDENVARYEQQQQQQEEELWQLQANHIQYNTDNMARICLRRRRRGTSKVHQLNELKIIKSHKEKFLEHSETEKLNSTFRKETLSSRSNMECYGCEKSAKSLVVLVGTTQSGSARNVDNCAITVRRWGSKRIQTDRNRKSNNHNNNNNDDHVIVKLNLKSNAKFADCLMDNSNSNNSNNNHTKVIAVNKDADKEYDDDNNTKTLRKSHETRVEDKVAREVNRKTTRQMAMQRQHKTQLQQQQQQYQNYYCPTGKSCCCYVQSSTRATTTTTLTTIATCAADEAAMNKCLSTSSETSSTNNNNNNNNNNEVHVAAAKIAKKEKSEDQQLLQEVTTKLSTQSAVAAATAAAAAIDVASTTGDSNVWSATAPVLAHNNCNQRLTKTSTTKTTTTTTTMTTSLPRDWQVFAHLTEVHHVAVAHYYGAFGARIRVSFMHSKSIPCINVWQEGCTTQQPQHHANNNQKQQFFVARIPLTTQAAPTVNDGATQEIAAVKDQFTSSITTNASKYAIFLWHLNLTDDVVDVDVENCNYDTIIESRRTGVRWFGAAHALAKTSWPQIHAEGHFMLHTVVLEAATAAAATQQVIALRPGEQQRSPCDDDDDGDCDGDDDDFFDIVIKIKYN